MVSKTLKLNFIHMYIDMTLWNYLEENPWSTCLNPIFQPVPGNRTVTKVICIYILSWKSPPLLTLFAISQCLPGGHSLAEVKARVTSHRTLIFQRTATTYKLPNLYYERLLRAFLIKIYFDFTAKKTKAILRLKSNNLMINLTAIWYVVDIMYVVLVLLITKIESA